MIKNLKFKIKNYGYTLVEVLVAVSIFVIIIGMVVAMFTTNSRIQSKTQATRETSQTLRYIMEAIGREIELADGCIITGTTVPPMLNTANGSLILARTDKTNPGSCLKHSYSLSAEGDLQVSVNDASPINLNSQSVKIKEFTVTPDYAASFYTAEVITQQPGVQIIIKGEYSVGSKKAESSIQTLRTAFTTRNYPGFNDITQ